MALSTGLRERVHRSARLFRPRLCWRVGAGQRRSLGLRKLVPMAFALALAGCGLTGGGTGTLIVDPSRYEGYHCNDLAGQWNGLLARQHELQSLMDKAGDGGGALIGNMTYRADYETVLGEQKVLQRTAAEKNCALTPTYQSDQTIR
jgi:hypothetical protein